MLDLDELLQEKLTAIEKGQPLEDVLASLPEGTEELVPLLRLTATVRSLPQPEPSPAQVQADQEKIAEVVRDSTLPGRSVDTNPTRPVSRPLVPVQPRRGIPARVNWRWAVLPAGLGAMAALFIGAVLLTAVLAFWLNGPRSAHAATLMDVTGQVELASANGASDWRLVDNGAQIKKGQVIRTAGASSATLVFFEGTRTILGPDSELALTTLDGNWGNSLRVQIDQRTGNTSNSVVPLKGQNSQFVINTPSGSASVHGTRFNVLVDQKGESRFAVTTGKVLVSNQQSKVFVNSGQVTAIMPGSAAIPDPTYQFSLQGTLSNIDGNSWTVANVPFTVNNQTDLNGNFEIGSVVTVTGSVQPDGSRIADNVIPAYDTSPVSSFTGPIESMQGDTWEIGGEIVTITSDSQVASNLKNGDTVTVNFRALDDGTWQVLTINPLADNPVEPEVVPSVTPDPNAKPDLAFDPEEVQAVGCENEFVLAGTLTNEATQAKDYAADVQLGYLISKGGGSVNSVEIYPSNIPTLQAGQSVTFTIQVNLKDGWQNAQKGSNQIKLNIYLAHEANRPDHLKSRLTATIRCGAEEDETPQPSGTVFPTPTGTPEDQLSPTPEGTRTTCTGANPHPEGMRLAQRYGVSYEEIMGWFCQRFGFGEIDLAYGLSQQTGRPVAEIFAMKQSGMGWGQIKKQLQPQNQNNEDNGNGNGNGNGKPPKKPKP